MNSLIDNLPIRQRPRIEHHVPSDLIPREYWSVRDERGGPFGPVGVSQAEAEAWLADPVRVTVVATLQDHQESPHSYNDWGGRRCRCGAESSNDTHLADMIAGRLVAAGVVV